MKSKENDELMAMIYQQNVSKIPPFMRITKKSKMIAGILLAVIFISLVTVILIKIPFGSKDSLTNLESAVNLTAYIFVAGIPVILVISWYFISRYLDHCAFIKASEFAAKHSQWEEEKIKESQRELQFQKMETVRMPADGKCCPKCGAPMLDIETRCTSCGEWLNE